MQFSVCFLKNISPSERLICFILNNLHFPMVQDIAFYTLYKSRVMTISCKADDFNLIIGPANEIEKSRLVSSANFKVNFFIVL